MATHSSILAWEIHWTEGPSGLQSMGSQRVEYDGEIEHKQDKYGRNMQIILRKLKCKKNPFLFYV